MAGSHVRPQYWVEYSNLQKIKHDLIRSYLNGWFPKLSWAGRVIYFDTHAGRGRHAAGQLGSPLVALDALLQHTARQRILSESEVLFYFIERDEENVRQLELELDRYTPLPAQIKCRPVLGDCFALLEEFVHLLRDTARSTSPAFFFIDPFGFKIPGRLLRELMSFPRVELFVNVIWRELDMA